MRDNFTAELFTGNLMLVSRAAPHFGNQSRSQKVNGKPVVLGPFLQVNCCHERDGTPNASELLNNIKRDKVSQCATMALNTSAQGLPGILLTILGRNLSLSQKFKQPLLGHPCLKCPFNRVDSRWGKIRGSQLFPFRRVAAPGPRKLLLEESENLRGWKHQRHMALFLSRRVVYPLSDNAGATRHVSLGGPSGFPTSPGGPGGDSAGLGWLSTGFPRHKTWAASQQKAATEWLADREPIASRCGRWFIRTKDTSTEEQLGAEFFFTHLAVDVQLAVQIPTLRPEEFRDSDLSFSGFRCWTVLQKPKVCGPKSPKF